MKIGFLSFLLVGLISTAGLHSAEAKELTLYIMRHGKTMLNTSDRVQGWSDAVLTPAGEEVVKAAGRGLKDVVFQGAYSSDSGRALQTSRMVLDANKASSGLQVVSDARLREFNFGTFEGDHNKTMWAAVAAHQGVSVDEFMNKLDLKGFANSVAELDAKNPDSAKTWPAENYEQITARLSGSLADIVKTETAKGDGNVLIVSHGLSIMTMLKNQFPDFVEPPEGLKNASVSIIKVKDGSLTLGKVNDLSYVEAGKQ